MQLVNAVSQNCYRCAETSKLNFFHGHGHTVKCLANHVIKKNPSKLEREETEGERERERERERFQTDIGSNSSLLPAMLLSTLLVILPFYIFSLCARTRSLCVWVCGCVSVSVSVCTGVTLRK